MGNSIKCLNKGHILVLHIRGSKGDPLLVLSHASIILESVKLDVIIIEESSVALKTLAKLGSRIKTPIISLFAANSSLPFSKYPYLLQTGATLAELFGWRSVIIMSEALLAIMKKSSMFLLDIGWLMWFAEHLFLERSWDMVEINQESHTVPSKPVQCFQFGSAFQFFYGEQIRDVFDPGGIKLASIDIETVLLVYPWFLTIVDTEELLLVLKLSNE
ncbi:hypothetical protein HRI_000708600 [Hibiscus trionum]|uniref:Receptor ligand binding region domain-containing protein n=1 Tax=Hibiscus trionum TaxID=183268 RepID=A0A9W7H493_HIBTR|nr:hypothetical protein HRI_000708600 [Hibiscus trionum]